MADAAPARAAPRQHEALPPAQVAALGRRPTRTVGIFTALQPTKRRVQAEKRRKSVIIHQTVSSVQCGVGELWAKCGGSRVSGGFANVAFRWLLRTHFTLGEQSQLCWCACTCGGVTCSACELEHAQGFKNHLCDMRAPARTEVRTASDACLQAESPHTYHTSYHYRYIRMLHTTVSFDEQELVAP